jgi:hypothetical protein
MRDRDALLKRFLVRAQLFRMHERGEITASEFETASAVIYREEQHLMNETREIIDSSQMNRLFLDGLNELKSASGISEGLAQKLMLGYARDMQAWDRGVRSRTIPTPEMAQDVGTEDQAVREPPFHDAQVERSGEVERTREPEPLVPQPTGDEGIGEPSILETASEMTAPRLEMEMDEEVSAQEEEIARHAGVAEIFRAFLQERNIRWIELVATLMIVGFAIPLAVTLWQLAHNVGKYLIFLGATLVIFGGGWYTRVRLGLSITGKAFLTSAFLLIPLHFLALDLMQLHILVSVVALAVLGVVGHLTTRLMQIENGKILAGVYLLLSGLHIAVKPLSLILSSGFLLACLAWLALASGVVLLSQPSRNRDVINQEVADGIYFFLGTLSYAFALLLFRIPFTPSLNLGLSQLSPLIFLGGLPGIYYGYQLLTKADEQCNARTGGTIVLIIAHFLTLVALILGYFTPEATLITSLLVTSSYGYLAFINRKPFFIYTTIITFGIAYISGSCLLIAAVRGTPFSWFPLGLAQTTVALMPLGLLYWACGYFLKRKELSELALPVHWTGVLLAGVLTLGSLEQIEIARYVLLFYAVVLSILAFLWKQPFFTYWACGALVAGFTCFFYQLGVRVLGHYSLLIALVASTYLLLGHFMTRRTDDSQWKPLYGTPLINSSLVLNPIATGVVIIGTLMPATGWASLITSLLCGGVVTANFICYTPIYRQTLFVYLGSATFLGTILGAFYKLEFPMPVFPLALASVGMLDFILGFWICKKTKGEMTRRLYGLAFVNSALAASILAVIWVVSLELSNYTLITGLLVAGLYLFCTWVYRENILMYAACGAILLTCLATFYLFVSSVFPPFGNSAFVVAAYAYIALGLGYYLLRRWQLETTDTAGERIGESANAGAESFPRVNESTNHAYSRVYAYPLINSALATSVLLVVSSFAIEYVSAIAAGFLAAILYLLALKSYPHERWLYPVQILFTWGILLLTWRLAERFFTTAEWPVYASSIALCTLANVWVLLGLMVRKRKEAICAHLNLPVKTYDTPFFHWTTIIDSLAFFILALLGINGFTLSIIDPSALSGEGAVFIVLICQILISLSLFLFLYRGFRQFHTVLLYTSGWLTLGWLSIIAGLPSGYVILVTALYAALWYMFVRLKSKVHNALQRIQLAFTEAERPRLLETINLTLICNTALALALAAIRINAIQGIVSIFIIAAIYLMIAFDKKQMMWSYLGIAVSILGCYAFTSALLPFQEYGWTMVLSCGLLSIGLAYFWTVFGVSINVRREEMDFFTEPCKWMGIALTAVGFIPFTAFMLNVGREATLFQVSIGALGFVLGTIFYLWLAWVLQTETLVYAAELALAGTFAFVRLTVPQWFSTQLFREFWPVIVVGISFVAFGLSYALQRLKLAIYVRPLYYMSILLTLIPLVGTWFVGIEISIGTLVGTGVFYSMLAVVRRQRRDGYIAVTLFNLALQVSLIWQGLRFSVHPQLFITPIGLTLLGIAHLNRHEFSPQAVRSLRSFAAIIIYVSSTTELYTARGAAPIILAALCLLGILSGMALRIRLFLYLGTAFLLLDILVQIYRAGQTNSWIWWISGISFGLAILVIFAWFERKREQVLSLLDSLKEWD